MAYTAPKTWVADEVVSASDLNTYLRDNDLWVLTDSPAVQAYHSTSQTATTATWLSLVYDSERFDNAGMHSTSSNTNRLTVPTGGAGKYVVAGNAAVNGSVNGTERNYRLTRNGTTVIGRDARSPAGGSGGAVAVVFMALCIVTSAAVADYFDSWLYQDAGADLTVPNAAEYVPEFYAFWFRT